MCRRLLRFILPAILAFACGVPRELLSQEPFPLRYSTKPISHAETLLLLGAADSVEMVLSVQTTDDGVLTTIKVLSRDSVYQDITAVFDPQSLEPKEVRETRPHSQGILTYADSRVRGTVVGTSPRGTPDSVRIDRPIATTGLDRRALLHVTGWLPLSEEHTFAVLVYDQDRFGAYELRIKTGGTARVVVPAGTFDAYRVEMTAGTRGMVCPPSLVPAVFYISADSLRLLLRVERPAAGQTFELLRWGAP